MKRAIQAVLLVLMSLILAGCGFKATDELYALPMAPAEFKSLEVALRGYLDDGFKYAAPISGLNTQPVQMQDLDSDGLSEVVAFFRNTKKADHPLKIVVFKIDDEGNYVEACKIEGDGVAINSIVYDELNNCAMEEIVVGWCMSNSVYGLSVYSIEDYNPREVLSASNYTRYSVVDMDQDNESEIVVFQMGSQEQGGNSASLFNWKDDKMQAVNAVPLSKTMANLQSVISNYATDFSPALYVTGGEQDNTQALVTDMLCVVDGKLKNTTMNEKKGYSDTRHGSAIRPDDINNDSIVELPFAIALNASAEVENSDQFTIVQWNQYGTDGEAQTVSYTYHDTSEGWYIELPAVWSWKLDRLIMNHDETSTGVSSEKSISFYFVYEKEQTPQRVLTIYKEAATSGQTDRIESDRFLLCSTDNEIYTASINEKLAGWSQDSVIDSFHLIMADWSEE